MSFQFKIVIFCLSTVIITDCGDNELKRESLKTIDIESNVKNFAEIKLSQFNVEINYIPLSDDEKLYLEWIGKIDADSNFFLISNSNLCLLYDNSGKFIKKIGNLGNGPDEYSTIINSGFGYSNNIYIQSFGKFLEFDLTGKCISSFNLKDGRNKEFFINSWTILNDSLFFGQVPILPGNHLKALIFNKKGASVREFQSYFIPEWSNSFFSSDDSQATFYKFSNETYFKEKMNDTLFNLSNDFILKPRIHFNLGKFKRPPESRGKFITEPVDPFIYLNNLFELPDYIFLDCQFGKNTPAQRFTPREIMGVKIMYNTTNVLGVYNKNKGELEFSKPTTTDNQLFTTGFYNDIDAGPRFYPVRQLNDSTMVMWIDAKILKEHVASVDFKNNNPIYPEKKKNLEELAGRLSDFDNPVLMIVTLKK